MASGKRASMREGPLAALFRRTDEAGDLTQDPAAPDEAPRAKQRPQPADERAPEVAPRASRAQRAPREPAESRKPASRKAPERKPAPEPEEAPAPSASTAAGQRREREYPHPGLGSRDELPTDRPRIPTPQERLRHAFSSEIPDNIMEPPRREPAPEAPRPAAPAPRDPFAHGDHDPNWGEAKAVGQPVLRVVGVGGAGVNAVNRMVEAEVVGVEFIAINTDVQSLQQSTADITLHIGPQVTRGLGAGSDPDLGRAAAMDEYDRIKALLKGSDMIFIAAGAGGGTGTGAAPVVARSPATSA